MQATSKNLPSVKLSLIPVLSLITLLVINVRLFGDAAIDGSIQIVLLFSTIICVALSMWKQQTKWHRFEAGFVKSIAGSTSAIQVLLFIGAMAGTWMLSGVIPAMIYYGLKFINPTIFLATACSVAAIVSVSSGSSWTTIATIGVGLMGIGKALGIDPGWVAGAVISGGYFGDKISPLSETTNMASGVAGADLFSHIKYLMITTVPSFSLTLLIFLLYGFFGVEVSEVRSDELSLALQQNYNLSPWLFIIPLVTFILIMKRVPALIVLVVGVLMGGLGVVVFQPDLCKQLVEPGLGKVQTLAKGIIQAIYGPVSITTGNEMLDSLVATKGMKGMLNTVWLIICAMTFGGAMEASGMLKAITDKMLGLMKNTFLTVASTSMSCMFLNLATGDQYISILLPGRMFSEAYKEKGYQPELLSRTLEDSATVTSVLIPWNSCGMAQSAVLGVATMTYMPYCFFNILSPIMTLIVAAIGFKIKKPIPSVEPINEEEESELILSEAIQ